MKKQDIPFWALVVALIFGVSLHFPLDLKPDVLAAHRAACEKNGTTPAAELKKFIAHYTEQAGE